MEIHMKPIHRTICSLLALLTTCPGGLSAQPASKPNIIYILADDLGYGDLGCYGQKLIRTPNIDQIAKDGIKLTDHYSGSALCAPSRCVLMTGLHSGHSYIRGNRPLPVEGNVPLPAGTQTIPKLLKSAGYATGAMGKWGLGYPGSEGDPNMQGFDHFFGYNCQRQAHKYYPPHLWRNQEKVMLEGNSNGKKEQYSHDLLTIEALEFIRGNSGRPFFLYLPYTIPHTEFAVPELGIYADEAWTENQRKQAAMISRLDRDVGTIRALLKELDLEKNTLVIFTSDNGPHGGGGTLQHFNAAGPLRAKKGSLYEGGIRVPFVACWPRKIAAGTLSDHPSCFYDMLPTFAELGGAKVETPTDGISMLPTLLGQGMQKKHDYLYWELNGKVAVRMGNWKGVKSKKGQLELFDLSNDLGEKNNIAKVHPETAEKIQAIMESAHTEDLSKQWEYTGPLPAGDKKKAKKKRP
jgi:arylsulfatase A